MWDEKIDVCKRTVSCLKRWTRTRSKRGTRDLIDLKVACAAWTAYKYNTSSSSHPRDKRVRKLQNVPFFNDEVRKNKRRRERERKVWAERTMNKRVYRIRMRSEYTPPNSTRFFPKRCLSGTNSITWIHARAIWPVHLSPNSPLPQSRRCHSQIAQSWTWMHQYPERTHNPYTRVWNWRDGDRQIAYSMESKEPRENSINTMSVDDLVKLDKVTIMLHQKRHVNRQTSLSRGRQRYKQNIAETTKVKPRAKR